MLFSELITIFKVRNNFLWN